MSDQQQNQGMRISDELEKCIWALQQAQATISKLSGDQSGEVSNKDTALAFSYLKGSAIFLTNLAARVEAYGTREARVAEAGDSGESSSTQAVRGTKDYLN